MCRTKSTARRSYMIAAAPTRDVASSSAISQRRGGVPSQQNQFTRKYEAHWKDDLSM